MGSWRKLLERMVADPKPRSYSYDEAATVLGQLGFQPKGRGGSHRKWRKAITEPDGTTRGVIIGLLDTGRGNLPPEYIQDMVQILRENNLLPDGVE